MKRNKFNLRDAARLIALPWAAWWIYFSVVSTWFVPNPTSLDFKVALVAVAVFAYSALFVWWHELPGAALLAIEGLAVIIGYPILAGARIQTGSVAFVIATLGAPPLFSGTVLLWLRFFPRIRRTA